MKHATVTITIEDLGNDKAMVKLSSNPEMPDNAADLTPAQELGVYLTGLVYSARITNETTTKEAN